MALGFRIRMILGTCIVVLSLSPVWIAYVMLPKSLPIIDEINYDDEHRKCLALNVYFEARNQPVRGQMAVAHVTLNADL